MAPEETKKAPQEEAGMTVSPKGGLRDNKGKARLSRCPQELIEAVATIFWESSTDGGGKYPMNNWQDLTDFHEMLDSLLRHAYKMAAEGPGALDPESGRPHSWHLATNIAMLIWHEKNGTFRNSPAPTESQTMTLSFKNNPGALLGMLAPLLAGMAAKQGEDEPK